LEKENQTERVKGRGGGGERPSRPGTGSVHQKGGSSKAAEERGPGKKKGKKTWGKQCSAKEPEGTAAPTQQRGIRDLKPLDGGVIGG